jgi:hypothetical protein
MQANTAVRRNTLQFDPNVAYELVLKYAPGREVSNGRIMFTTHSNECFFLDPDDAQKIHALGLSVNEPFKLMRRVIGAGKSAKTSIIVSRLGEQPSQSFAEGGPAASVPTAEGNTLDHAQVQPPQPNDKSLSGLLASSYLAAIDALIIAEQYAKRKGVTLRITEEEIRTSAHCIFIEVSKHKDRQIRLKEFAARYPSTQNGNGGAAWQRH